MKIDFVDQQLHHQQQLMSKRSINYWERLETQIETSNVKMYLSLHFEFLG